MRKAKMERQARVLKANEEIAKKKKEKKRLREARRNAP